MPALAELEQAWLTPRGRRLLRRARRSAAGLRGRPTPLYRAGRLSERVGRPVYLKREDLNHTGSHKLNNALGQALLAKRMGKTRIIAETGAGQHGVATATVCALLGLECVIYMGVGGHAPPASERTADAAARSDRTAGRRGRADAEGGDLGSDPRLGDQRQRTRTT